MSLGERVFETERLRLEPLRESHAAELFELLSDPRMYQFVPQEPPESLAWLAARYKRLESRASAKGDEAWLNWVARGKSDEACVGVVQVTLQPDGRRALRRKADQFKGSDSDEWTYSLLRSQGGKP